MRQGRLPLISQQWLSWITRTISEPNFLNQNQDLKPLLTDYNSLAPIYLVHPTEIWTWFRKFTRCDRFLHAKSHVCTCAKTITQNNGVNWCIHCSLSDKSLKIGTNDHLHVSTWIKKTHFHAPLRCFFVPIDSAIRHLLLCMCSVYLLSNLNYWHRPDTLSSATTFPITDLPL